MSRMTDTCNSCGAEIFWVETPNGKAMPFDAIPTQGYVPDPKVGEGPPANSGKLTNVHVTHFATCPDAENWSGQSRYEEEKQ